MGEKQRLSVFLPFRIKGENTLSPNALRSPILNQEAIM